MEKLFCPFIIFAFFFVLFFFTIPPTAAAKAEREQYIKILQRKEDQKTEIIILLGFRFNSIVPFFLLKTCNLFVEH